MVYIIQQVEFEGPGLLTEVLEELGVNYDIYLAPNNLPLLDQTQLASAIVILLGGPMNVSDRETLDWLDTEIRMIDQVVSAGGRVLGICLGAQILATILGAEIKTLSGPEIGVFSICQEAPEGHWIGQVQPATLDVLHWHGQTFGLPSETDLLCTSYAVRNQAFATIDKRVIGLQYHLETDLEGLENLIANDDYEPSATAQPPEKIRQMFPGGLSDRRKALTKLIQTWLDA